MHAYIAFLFIIIIMNWDHVFFYYLLLDTTFSTRHRIINVHLKKSLKFARSGVYFDIIYEVWMYIFETRVFFNSEDKVKSLFIEVVQLYKYHFSLKKKKKRVKTGETFLYTVVVLFCTKKLLHSCIALVVLDNFSLLI